MEEKNNKYFENQIKGFLLLLSDHQEETMIARSYVKEKLTMILLNGINFHPLIREKLEENGKRK